jgi:hypothetical protein
MKQLLVHGCYDVVTLETLLSLGVERFAFDLRPESLNLIPFSTLEVCLSRLKGREIVLIFQNESAATVKSFLDLVKNHPGPVTLEFRDTESASYYQTIQKPFFWMFNPAADWRSILDLPHFRGILLPLKLRDSYQSLTDLWQQLDQRESEVFLHSEVMGEAWELATQEVLISIDLTAEVERSYRCIDHERLKRMKLWRLLNETASL